MEAEERGRTKAMMTRTAKSTSTTTTARTRRASSTMCFTCRTSGDPITALSGWRSRPRATGRSSSERRFFGFEVDEEQEEEREESERKFRPFVSLY